MIQPVGGPKTPSHPTAASRTGPSTAPGPQDQVSLGGLPASEKPLPGRAGAGSPAEPPPPSQPARPALPPIAQEEPSFYRATMLPGLHDVEARFREGSLEGKAFQQAALSLSRTATEEQDPFVRRKARQVLLDRVHGTHPVADWQLRVGVVDGPVQVLSGWVKNLVTNDYESFSEDSLLPFLEALVRATDREVPEPALRAVAHLVRSLEERAGKELNPALREKETAAADRRWAAQCAAVVDGWHERGLLEVRRGDQVLRPGEVDLLAELSGRRAAIRGSVVDLSPPAVPRRVPPEVTATAEKILKDLRPGPEPSRLQDLARRDRAMAVQVVAALVEGAAPLLVDREASGRLGRLLEEAATSPELQELLRPHLPVLTRVTSPAEECGLLAPDNLVGQARVGCCRALLKAFPEVLTPEFLAREVGPLLQCSEINTSTDAARMMLELWKDHPETVAPTMDLALANSRDGVPWGVRQLVLPALKEHGWTPSPRQQDAILAELYHPLGKEPASLFASHDRAPLALDFLAALEERSPGYTDRLRLPDTRGQLVPARRALLERLLADPGKDLVGHLHTRSHGHFLASRLYEVIFPCRELAGELLDRFEEACQDGRDFASMPRDAQAAAAVLSSVPLSEEDEGRLDSLLAPQIPKRQAGSHLWKVLVEASRQRHVDREATRIAGLPLAGRLAPALELLTMVRETHDDYDPQSAAALKALAPSLAGADTSSLVAALKADLASGTPLGELSPGEIARLQLADAVAPGDALLDALRPRLREEVRYTGYGNRDVANILHRWRWTESLRALESPDTRLARRSEALELALFKAGSPEERGQVGTSLAAGLEGLDRPWRQAFRERFPDPESKLQAFRILAAGASDEEQVEEAWPRFAEVLDRVGGLDEAARVWPSWERNLAEGLEPALALRLAMREHALDGGAHEEAGEIRQTGTTVKIGGIELPLR